MIIPSRVNENRRSRIVDGNILEDYFTLPGATVIGTESDYRITVKYGVLYVKSTLSYNAELLMSYLTVDDSGVISSLMRIKAREDTSIVGKILTVIATHNTPILRIGNGVGLRAILKGDIVCRVNRDIVRAH